MHFTSTPLPMAGRALAPLVFALLISGIGALVVIYSAGYLAGDRRLGRFYLFLFSFMAAMLGIVLADNLFMMFVFWELVGFSSWLLINHYLQRQSAADAAKKAFITTRIGDVGLLIGIILLWDATGTFNIQEIIAAIEDPAVIVRILTHLGLPARAPPRASKPRRGLLAKAALSRIGRLPDTGKGSRPYRKGVGRRSTGTFPPKTGTAGQPGFRRRTDGPREGSPSPDNGWRATRSLRNAPEGTSL